MRRAGFKNFIRRLRPAGAGGSGALATRRGTLRVPERILKPPTPADPSKVVVTNAPADAQPSADAGRWPTGPGGSAAADDDRELVERARNRDEHAFRALVERHRDRAYGLALRIVRVPLDAEEVAQDAFVRAWNALPGFRAEARFSTWLYRIVARLAFDRAQSVRRRYGREAPLEAGAHAAAGGAERSAEVARALEMERLIGGLSEVQRAVVTLFYYEDCSVERVSETLAMPAGTVKTHLSRARAALREAWMRERHHEETT